MYRRLTLIALSTALAALALAPIARADTATIGSALALPYAGGVSTAAGTTTIQIQEVGGSSPFPLTSPANGAVTDWAVRTGDPDTLYVLRIMRPNGGDSYTSVNRVAAPTAVPPGTTDSIFHYPGNDLPISQGDSIGLLQTGTPDVGIAQAMTNGVTTNVFANQFADFPDGVAAAFTPDQQHELLLQATIKFCKVPNVVGQPEAAATAAVAAGDCTSAVRRQTLRLKAIKKKFSEKKKKKLRKRNAALRAQDGKVLSQSIAAGTTEATTGPPVGLTVGHVVPPKKKHHKKHHRAIA